MLRAGSAAAQEKAAAALDTLAYIDANKLAILLAGAIPPLVALAHAGSARAQEYAAGALRSLAANNAANQVAIAHAGAIPALVALAQAGSAGAQKQAAGALCSLAYDTANKVAIASMSPASRSAVTHVSVVVKASSGRSATPCAP